MAVDLIKPYLFSKILMQINCLIFGTKVGTDIFGNKYFELKTKNYWGVKKRICLYNGIPEASKISAEWLGWMHYKYSNIPSIKTKSSLAKMPIASLSKFRILSSRAKSYKPDDAIVESKPSQNQNAKPFALWNPESL